MPPKTPRDPKAAESFGVPRMIHETPRGLAPRGRARRYCDSPVRFVRFFFVLLANSLLSR